MLSLRGQGDVIINWSVGCYHWLEVSLSPFEGGKGDVFINCSREFVIHVSLQSHELQIRASEIFINPDALPNTASSLHIQFG